MPYRMKMSIQLFESALDLQLTEKRPGDEPVLGKISMPRGKATVEGADSCSWVTHDFAS